MQSEETDIFACRLLSPSWEMHPCLVLTPFKQTSTVLVLKKLANVAAWRPILLPFRYRSYAIWGNWHLHVTCCQSHEKCNLRKLTFACRLLSPSWEMHPVLTPFKQTSTVLVLKKLANVAAWRPILLPFRYRSYAIWGNWHLHVTCCQSHEKCNLRKLTFACCLLSLSWEMHPWLVLTPFKQTSTMLVLKKLANMAAWRSIFLPFGMRNTIWGNWHLCVSLFVPVVKNASLLSAYSLQANQHNVSFKETRKYGRLVSN